VWWKLLCSANQTPNKMKHLKFLALWFFGATILFTSCKKDEEVEETPTPEATPGHITSNVTWSPDSIYRLSGRIVVTNGVTLTIEAGTIIKGETGIGAEASALIIARGGKIIAEGTAENPIIFTTVDDEIDYSDLEAGNFGSPNLTADQNGRWGGLIILGKAPISASASEVQIEGIPTSEVNGLYGGNNPNDNSGVLRYVSIRHGGTDIGNGNEINGLTLGGVGSGTFIDNIEVVANQDDGIEWFGGTVDVSNVVVWKSGDDAIDTDQAWSGTLTNFVVVNPAGNCLELDGPEGTLQGTHTIERGSIKADACGKLIQLDAITSGANQPSAVNLNNLFFTSITAPTQVIDQVNISGVLFNTVLLNVNPTELTTYTNGNTPANGGIVAGTDPQANISELQWTWTFKSGAMSGLY
jgi:hypothetical protein